MENDEHYSSKTWTTFVASEISRPIPGSLNFIKYANSKGLAVFHVSTRKGPEEAPTRENLTKLGHPVGKAVGSPKNDRPELVEPVREGPAGERLEA